LKEILLDAGTISAEIAKAHVHGEYEKFAQIIENSTPDEWDKAVKRITK
jgi:hypothetical protein